MTKPAVIKTDDENGSFRITSYLIGLGHRRIALIQAPAGSTVNRNRTRGYVRALENAGIRVLDSYIVPGGFSTGDGQRAVEALMRLSSSPTAVVAANDLVAIGAIAALKRIGKEVPGDMSVAGYDNIQMSELVDPALTTISQPTYEMGKQAMEAVLTQIRVPGTAGKVIQLEKPHIVRQSTGKPNLSPKKPKPK